MNKENIFIQLSKKQAIEVGKNVYIKDIGKVYANDEKIKEKIENLKIYSKASEEDWDFIDSTEILKKVGEYNPNINVNILGSENVLLEIKSQESKSPIFEFFKVLIVCLLLFFGTALAIVNFHEDVNMQESIEKLYHTMTGEKKSNPFIMTIPYTIGLGLGVIIFFNRIISSSRRRKKEPGPMEIELYLYDADMEECILETMVEKGKKKNKR